ncbi:hypothetical protein CBR_g56580 [Chara braunii]|uniref:Myb-like domain-containing protein n=1 Tax=Chara braunii TaxID=69332 RepID=A0A388MDJ7_CHABU|nr:hypothetical protein CBR_g56580 [Chara braunii]|eukprot:GBG92636.1 hypothetical protein CBR_g56580 [Chara braunii]
MEERINNLALSKEGAEANAELWKAEALRPGNKRGSIAIETPIPQARSRLKGTPHQITGVPGPSTVRTESRINPDLKEIVDRHNMEVNLLKEMCLKDVNGRIEAEKKVEKLKAEMLRLAMGQRQKGTNLKSRMDEAAGLSDNDSSSEEYYIPAAPLPTQQLSTSPSRELVRNAHSTPGGFSSLLSDEPALVGRAYNVRGTPHLARDGVERALSNLVASGMKHIDLEQPPIDMEEPQSGQQEPVPSDEEDDSQKRASSDGKGSGGKRCQQASWDRNQITVLVEAKREKAAVIAAGGHDFNSPKLMWPPIADAMKQATGREVKKWDSCKKKWRQLTGSYREIRDFMLKSGAPSCWTMSAAERKHPKIGDVPFEGCSAS